METSKAFWLRYTAMGACFSIPLALMAAAYLGEVLRLAGDEWRTLMGLVAILVGPAFAIGSTLQRRQAIPLLHWMDDPEPSPEASIAAVRAARRLPLHAALLGQATWFVGATLVVLGAVFRIERFGTFECAATMICALGAALLSSLFSYSMGKRLVRPALTSASRQAPHAVRGEGAFLLSLSMKLQAAFVATGVVPLLLVVFLVQRGVEAGDGSALFAPLAWVTGIAGVCAVFLGAVFGREVTETAQGLSEVLARVSAGDLSEPTGIESDDELGAVARSCDRLIENLREAVTGMRKTAEGLDGAAGVLEDGSAHVVEASQEQLASAVLATDAVAGIESAVRGIAERSESLSRSVQESSSAVAELGATGEELQHTATTLSTRIESAVPALREIAETGQKISANVSTLVLAADDASGSTHELAASISEADRRAGEAGRVAESVATTSQQGRDAVRSVDRGMRSISGAVNDSAGALQQLVENVARIGSVVQVIDEVAADTHLLSLNAAIIAAQAGENGRAFTVVASEVKELAQRVSTRTHEIAGIIEAVENGSRAAAAAMDRSRDSVRDGESLTRSAGEALEEIGRAAAVSGEHASAIAGSAAEQREAVQHVLGIVAGFAAQLHEIEAAVGSQSQSQASVIDVANAVREVSVTVQRTSEEQARGTKTIRDELLSVEQTTSVIDSALRSQSEDCERSLDQVNTVRAQAAANEAEIGHLRESIDALRDQAVVLRALVERFDLGAGAG